MDREQPIRLPVVAPERHEDNLVDVRAGIDLVVHGLATRVVVANLSDPEAIAAVALAIAQAAGVDFAIERDPESGAAAIVVGPLSIS